jgi:uncharacterized protein (TIGR03067 family)
MLAISLFVISITVATLGPVDPIPAALKELQGEWRAVSVEEKGFIWDDKKEVAAVVLEITGDTLIYKRNKPIEKFRITLDAKAKPARMDLRLIDKDVDPAKVCPCIYALDGGKLKLCLPSEFTAQDPGRRPAEFKTEGERPPLGRLLFVMERDKK